MTKQALDSIVRIHKALGHPVRLRILAMLREGPLCVCQMNAVVGLAPSTISQHLSELRNAELISERKEGRWVEYRLADGEDEILGPIWDRLEDDPVRRSDAVLLEALRDVSLEELCGAGLDLSRLGKHVVAAVARADAIRGEAS
ncbi:MAG: metalloregulator ArsR/SmtB family transcription factor [Thermoanaerobaculia bacterium]|nr:metalloregulator ArsR/SmtB family transcription factor [Thermoanaerobaculia bacterium]